MGKRFRHAAGVEVREVGDEFFLAAPGPGTIHHLDRMASAAWRALAKPRSVEEMIGLFEVAFPSMPRRKIAKDVAEVLAFLETSKLIVSAPQRMRE
jgi:Coenzyme PQQ synthesis protein D (PqqD)